jgi:mono/diheme cytochrome c family protein
MGCGAGIRLRTRFPWLSLIGRTFVVTKAVVLSALLALAVAGSLRAQQPADSLYAKNCLSCHGAKGTPNPAMAHSMAGLPDFADAHTLASVADSTLKNVVSAGKGRMMPSYKSRLTPEQIASLVRYIRTLSRH